jgi:hypothetical protein
MRPSMVIDQQQKYREMASRGKYRDLYRHLCGLQVKEWQTSFREIESILGFTLPASARLHRPWWANQSKGNGHSHALAWSAAGWETANVDMNAETLLLRRKHADMPRKLSLDEILGPPHSVGEWPFKRKQPEGPRKFDLDEVLPVHDAGEWPEGLSLRREDMYDDRMYPASCS